MVIEYKKDLYHNYLRIRGYTYDEESSYCLRMLEAEGLSGLLKPDCRRLDDQVYLYYDITAKQSLASLLVKSALSKDSLKQLLAEVFEAVETAYEYLLDEKGILISPETIFYNLNTSKYEVCYLPGYDKDVNNQIVGFMEFLMNKADYNDKEAVLLIYSLYAAGREEDYAFNHMLQILQNPKHPQSETIQKTIHKTLEGDPIKTLVAVKSESESKQMAKAFPVMLEKESREQEEFCYPMKTYLGTAGSCLAALLILIFCIKTKLCYNSLGYRIDYSKLFGILLILVCGFGYLIMKLWDKKNRITKMITIKEYHDPRLETDSFGIPTLSKERRNQPIAPMVDLLKKKLGLNDKKRIQKPLSDIEYGRAMAGKEEEPSVKNRYIEETVYNQENGWNKTMSDRQKPEGEEEELNPTCLLNASEPDYCCILKPAEGARYDPIPVTNFPFFIGKLRKNVDYCLEKEVVSRYHAKITREGDKYYLTDLNSTNGTFLNREALMTYQQKELKPGDEISFANIRYLFILE